MKCETKYLKEIEILTNRYCNLRCRFCDAWTNPINYDEIITYNDIKKALTNIHNWLKRPLHLSLAGGESFMRQDILQIIKFAESHGFFTSVTTNGTLINKKMAQGIIKSNLSGINISIDSLDPQKHDYIRGVNGTLKRALAGLHYLNQFRKEKKDKPLWLNIATVITKLNHKDIVQLLKFVEKEGIDTIILQPISPIFFGDRKDWYDDKLWPKTKKEQQEICKTIDKLILLKKKNHKILNSVAQLIDMKSYFSNLDLTYQRRFWE